MTMGDILATYDTLLYAKIAKTKGPGRTYRAGARNKPAVMQ